MQTPEVIDVHRVREFRVMETVRNCYDQEEEECKVTFATYTGDVEPRPYRNFEGFTWEGYMTSSHVDQIYIAIGRGSEGLSLEVKRRHLASVPMVLYLRPYQFGVPRRKVAARIEYMDSAPKPQAPTSPNPSDPNGSALMLALQKNVARIQHVHAQGKSVDQDFVQEMLRELSLFKC